MLFSIIVPVYNVEEYLIECMDSLLAQDRSILSHSEIILVDDGSTDNSGAICDIYKNQYPELVKVFHKKNEGLLMTRRFGYKQSGGKYIINCDSDDVMEKSALAQLYKVVIDYNFPDVVIFNCNLFDGKATKVAKENIFSHEHLSRVNKNDVIKCFLRDYSIVSLAVSICKRECININQNYESISWISNGEDTIQKIEIIDNARSFVYLNRSLYNYRGRVGMTARFDADYYKSFRVAFDRIEKMKNKWTIPEFDMLMSIKVLSTAGRAITQSRLHKWEDYKKQKQYLVTLRNDDLLKKNLIELNKVNVYIQRNYRILLKLLKHGLYFVIIIILNCINIIDKTKNTLFCYA